MAATRREWAAKTRHFTPPASILDGRFGDYLGSSHSVSHSGNACAFARCQRRPHKPHNSPLMRRPSAGRMAAGANEAAGGARRFDYRTRNHAIITTR